MNKYAIPAVSVLVLSVAATAFIWVTADNRTEAHCQVPCGIYDDPARIQAIREDATTIEKAIAQIRQLSGRHDPNAFNQAARWVTTKEAHATHIIDVVSEYFLTQKVKPATGEGEAYDAYLKSLANHHAVMVAAMKTKQSADSATVDALNKAIDALAPLYKAAADGNEIGKLAAHTPVPEDPAHPHDHGATPDQPAATP